MEFYVVWLIQCDNSGRVKEYIFFILYILYKPIYRMFWLCIFLQLPLSYLFFLCFIWVEEIMAKLCRSFIQKINIKQWNCLESILKFIHAFFGIVLNVFKNVFIFFFFSAIQEWPPICYVAAVRAVKGLWCDPEGWELCSGCCHLEDISVIRQIIMVVK